MEQGYHADEIRAYLEARLLDYIDMLRRMVSINSFTANSPGVDTLGDLTAGFFQNLGFQADRVSSVNPLYGHHLILTRKGQGERTIGLVSHLDTVYPESEEIQNDFSWRVEGDRLYGPGALDIKGGTLIIYMMMEAMQQFAPQLFADVNWVVLLDASEESDGEDFGALCLERLSTQNTRACLIFEGGKLNEHEALVVVARKGMAVFQVTAEGKGSHAGSAHEQGANAIVQIAHTIGRIAAMTDYERKLTFNVGTVAGGTVVNRVPHFASTKAEMRTYDVDVFAQGVADMMALAEQPPVASSADGYACRVQVEMLRTTPPWNRNAATDRLFNIWQEVGSEIGVNVRPEVRGGLSDGNYFWHLLPSLDGLGASGNNAHCSERSPDGDKDQEYAHLASFVPKALLNTLAVLKLLSD